MPTRPALRVAGCGAAALACLLTGCTLAWLNRSAGYDARPMTVQTVDLFNQRSISRLVRKSWKGDWIFRRDRLEMVDQALRNTKPDLLLMQEAMERVGSAAEADRRILRAGALSDYDWQEQKVQDYPDTQEREMMAVATAVPLKLDTARDQAKSIWQIGSSGYLQAAAFDYEGQQVLVLNVQMPTGGSAAASWYDFVLGRARDLLQTGKYCPRRVIIGGFLPGDETNTHFAELLRSLQLKDVAAGFCEVAGRCYTATPVNDIFMAAVGEEAPARTDKLLVHQSANIYSSSRDFEEYDSTNRYGREFGLSRLWPTLRFGWKAQLRLARCRSDELGIVP